MARDATFSAGRAMRGARSRLPVASLIVAAVFLAAAPMFGRTMVTSPQSVKWLAAILVGLGAGLFTRGRPFNAFLLFMLTLPLEAAFVLEVGFTIRTTYFAILLVLAIILIQSRFQRLPGSFRSPITSSVLVFVAAAILSMGMTVVSSPPQVEVAREVMLRASAFRGIIQVLLLLLYVMGFFLAVFFCSDHARLSKVLRVHIWTVTVLSIYGLYQYLAWVHNLPFADITNALSTGGGFYGTAFVAHGRSFATFQEPLNFGHYLLSGAPLMLALYLGGGQLKRQPGSAPVVPVRLWMVLVVLFALVLTRSRGAWLGFGLAFLFFLFLSRPGHTVRLLMFMAAVITSVAILFARAEWVREQGGVAAAFRVTQGFQADYRPPELQAAIDFYRTHPVYWVLGTGLGNYGVHAAALRGHPLLLGAQSLPAAVLVETGAIGFVAFVFMLASYFIVLLRTLWLVRGTGWEPYLVGYITGSAGLMFQHTFTGDRIALYVWVFMGLAMATVTLIAQERTVPIRA